MCIATRHRSQLTRGMDVEESAAQEVGTAGSAVVFARATVQAAPVTWTACGSHFLSAARPPCCPCWRPPRPTHCS
ncbi:MMPL family transporter [Streptomyces venezuelae]